MQTYERSGSGIDLRVLDVSGLDLAKAAPDAIATNAGYGPASPHPLAEDLYDINLATIAAHYGGFVNVRNAEHGIKAISAGMSSLEFKSIIEKTGRSVIEKTFTRDDTLNKIARPLPKEDLRGHVLSGVSIESNLGEITENGERPMLMGRMTENETPPLKSYGLAIYIRRRDIVNNDQLLIAQLFAEAGAMAQRHEVKTTLDYIESNPTLPELDNRGGADRPWFTEDDGNLIAGGGVPSMSTFSEANDLMRSQSAANGDKENIAPRFVVCSSKYEYSIRDLITESGLPLEVVPSVHVDESHYYLIADPTRQPALGVQFVAPPTARRIKTWLLSQVPKLPIEMDGIGYTLDVDLSPVAVSRKGIVRVEI